jgi:hypothetical protein
MIENINVFLRIGGIGCREFEFTNGSEVSIGCARCKGVIFVLMDGW